MVRSILHGVALWAHEIIRPGNERTAGIVDQEGRRAAIPAYLYKAETG